MLKFGTQVVINTEFYSNIRGSIVAFECRPSGPLWYKVRIFHYESGEWVDDWVDARDVKAL